MSQWKNWLIKTFVWVLRLFKGSSNPDSFLIVSTTGLGDTLWATPAIRALREAYPTSLIGCLTTPLGKQVLEGNPHINEFFILEKGALLKLYFQLRAKKFGTALFFHTSQRAILPLCAAVGIPRRIGTQGLQKGLDDLLTHAIPWLSGHEIDRRLDIVRAVRAKPQSVELEFYIGENDREKAKKIVPEDFVIGLHPGAKDRFKQWPPSYFVKVGQALQKELGCRVIVTATPAEKELAESIAGQIEGAKVVITSLKTMAAILENLTLFITNDTGPLHLALAMKTKVIALFTPTDPAICGPYAVPSAVVLKASPTCFPCLRKKCRDPFCLRQITPQEVIETALKEIKVYA